MKDGSQDNLNLKNTRKIFLTGLFTILPVAITLALVIWFFNKVDLIFRLPLEKLAGMHLYGVGFLITIAIIFLSGIFATNVLAKKIFKYFEVLMYKIPLIGIVYQPIKQLVDSIKNTSRGSFQDVVLVEYPSKGIYTIGFITSKTPDFISQKIGEICFSVFIPTTPNPTSGMFVMIPEKEIRHLNISVDDAIKLVVSGGILNVKEKGVEKNGL